eukprot:jgi/Mesvir1/24046/Mv10780-RA.1
MGNLRHEVHPATGRYSYSGQVVEVTRALCSAIKSGGHIYITDRVFAHLRNADKDVLDSDECEDKGLRVWHHGEHMLTNVSDKIGVLQISSERLAGRGLDVPKSLQMVSPSICLAPGFGATKQRPRVTLAYVTVPGLAPLLDWDSELTREALSQLYNVAQALCAEFEGYNCAPGDVAGLLTSCLGEEGSSARGAGVSFMVAFKEAAHALVWAVSLNERLQMVGWDPRLLGRTARAQGNPQSNGGVSKGGACVPSALGGLQVTIGIHSGVPTDVIPNPASGRALYQGPLVRQTQRLAYWALPQQILASQLVAVQLTPQDMESFEALMHCRMQCVGRRMMKGGAYSLQLYEVVEKDSPSALPIPAPAPLGDTGLGNHQGVTVGTAEEDARSPRSSLEAAFLEHEQWDKAYQSEFTNPHDAMLVRYQRSRLERLVHWVQGGDVGWVRRFQQATSLGGRHPFPERLGSSSERSGSMFGGGAPSRAGGAQSVWVV